MNEVTTPLIEYYCGLWKGFTLPTHIFVAYDFCQSINRKHVLCFPSHNIEINGYDDLLLLATIEILNYNKKKHFFYLLWSSVQFVIAQHSSVFILVFSNVKPSQSWSLLLDWILYIFFKYQSVLIVGWVSHLDIVVAYSWQDWNVWVKVESNLLNIFDGCSRWKFDLFTNSRQRSVVEC